LLLQFLELLGARVLRSSNVVSRQVLRRARRLQLLQRGRLDSCRRWPDRRPSLSRCWS
jgi:hypothetical protein